MNTQTYEYETKRLNHLGIVAGICQRLDLIGMIDGTLPSPMNRKVNCGQAIQAMALNALGLSGRALYLMPEYMKNKPIDAQDMRKRYEAVKITHGYLKDRRPDLKQVVVNLITSQASTLPLWLEVLDGNSSDQTTFRGTVNHYCKQLTEGESIPRFVFDSAGYSYDNLQAWTQIEWITRVPETLLLAQETIQCVSTDAMVIVDDNYKSYALCTSYADVKQRWLLVYSQKAFKREEKQLRRRIVKQQKPIEVQWNKLCCTQFHCAADAQAALQTFTTQLAWWQTEAGVTPVNKYKRRGRPAKGDIPEIVGWRIQGKLVVDEAIVG